jgi:hypothetical protein
VNQSSNHLEVDDERKLGPFDDKTIQMEYAWIYFLSLKRPFSALRNQVVYIVHCTSWFRVLRLLRKLTLIDFTLLAEAYSLREQLIMSYQNTMPISNLSFTTTFHSIFAARYIY